MLLIQEGRERHELMVHNYRDELISDLTNDSIPSERIKQIVARVIETMCNDEECEFQYDYPYLIEGIDDKYHLVYTWNKSVIKHITFSLSIKDSNL